MPYGPIVAVKAVINSSFLGGKEAMVNAGSWLVRDMKNKDKFPFDFNVGVAYLPRFDESVEGPRSNYSCSVLGIPENSKHKEEAWRFIRYYVEELSLIHIYPMVEYGQLKKQMKADYKEGKSPELKALLSQLDEIRAGWGKYKLDKIAELKMCIRDRTDTWP